MNTAARDPKRPANLPEGAKFLGRQPVTDLCSDDLFISRHSRKLCRLIDKDDDGGHLIVLTVADLVSGERDFIAIDKRARLNVWAA